MDSYTLQILTYICINAIAGLGMYIVLSSGSLVVFFGALMSIGALSSGLVSLNISYIPFPITVLIGGLSASIIGLFIYLPVIRLRGFYLAIATIGFGEILRIIAINVPELGGALGLRNVPILTQHWFVFIVTILIIYLFHMIQHSRFNLYCTVIRQNEEVALSNGINKTKIKLASLILGSFLAGIAGALDIHYLGLWEPVKFGFNHSVFILMIPLIGGSTVYQGAILGAIILTALPEFFRSLPSDRMIMFGIALILIMVYRKQGVLDKANISKIKRSLETLYSRKNKHNNNIE